MIRYFNPEAVRLGSQTIQQAPAGFRYGFIPNLLYEDVYNELVRTFPDTRRFKLVDKQSGGGRKRFYVGPGYFSGRHWGCVCRLSSMAPVWKAVLKEAASPEFISFFSDVTGVACNSLCDFGLTYGNQGCMQGTHIDGSARSDDPNEVRSTIACLAYFNDKPDIIGGTYVCDTDGQTILMQAPHLRNSLFFFEQHAQAWHGFPEMPAGAERHLLSLSYSQEDKPIALKGSLAHRLKCKEFYKTILRGV